MADATNQRDTFILVRGAYDKPGDKVTAAVPGCLPPLPEGVPVNRLGLARWLVDPQHPLTARVTVNRFWQQYFGTGIVKTAEDFGRKVPGRRTRSCSTGWPATSSNRAGT